jgi:hypothetical protein
MPASTIKRPRITEADQVRLDELEATISGTLPDPRPVPILGQSVWYWRLIDPTAGYGNGVKYLTPSAALIHYVYQPRPDTPLSLTIFGNGLPIERSPVPTTGEPAAEHWTWPIPGWVPSMGVVRPAPPPPVAPPPHLSLPGQRVLFGAAVFNGHGGGMKSEGLVPLLATVTAARGMDDVDLEVEGEFLPSYVRKPRGVPMGGNTFEHWWPVPRNRASVIVGCHGTYLEAPERNPDPYGAALSPETYRARVSRVEPDGKVSIELFHPQQTGKTYRFVGGVPRSDTPEVGCFTLGKYGVAAEKLMESVPA